MSIFFLILSVSFNQKIHLFYYFEFVCFCLQISSRDEEGNKIIAQIRLVAKTHVDLIRIDLFFIESCRVGQSVLCKRIKFFLLKKLLLFIRCLLYIFLNLQQFGFRDIFYEKKRRRRQNPTKRKQINFIYIYSLGRNIFLLLRCFQLIRIYRQIRSYANILKENVYH